LDTVKLVELTDTTVVPDGRFEHWTPAPAVTLAISVGETLVTVAVPLERVPLMGSQGVLEVMLPDRSYAYRYVVGTA
jgi:hypothetical protein